MADERDHLGKADHNQQFLDQTGDAFPDWLTVVAFYKAVHLVEALLARGGQHSRGHRERNNTLRASHPGIWKHFFALYNHSLLARYDCVPIDAQQVRDELVNKRLRSVESLVRQSLKPPPKRRRR